MLYKYCNVAAPPCHTPSPDRHVPLPAASQVGCGCDDVMVVVDEGRRRNAWRGSRWTGPKITPLGQEEKHCWNHNTRPNKGTFHALEYVCQRRSSQILLGHTKCGGQSYCTASSKPIMSYGDRMKLRSSCTKCCVLSIKNGRSCSINSSD
jgi:hypothetical protein